MGIDFSKVRVGPISDLYRIACGALGSQGCSGKKISVWFDKNDDLRVVAFNYRSLCVKKGEFPYEIFDKYLR